MKLDATRASTDNIGLWFGHHGIFPESPGCPQYIRGRTCSGQQGGLDVRWNVSAVLQSLVQTLCSIGHGIAPIGDVRVSLEPKSKQTRETITVTSPCHARRTPSLPACLKAGQGCPRRTRRHLSVDDRRLDRRHRKEGDARANLSCGSRRRPDGRWESEKRGVVAWVSPRGPVCRVSLQVLTTTSTDATRSVRSSAWSRGHSSLMVVTASLTSAPREEW
jgi:hypothetical protein